MSWRKRDEGDLRKIGKPRKASDTATSRLLMLKNSEMVMTRIILNTLFNHCFGTSVTSLPPHHLAAAAAAAAVAPRSIPPEFAELLEVLVHPSKSAWPQSHAKCHAGHQVSELIQDVEPMWCEDDQHGLKCLDESKIRLRNHKNQRFRVYAYYDSTTF